MNRIIVGYDGSDHARRALEVAAAIGNGASIKVVSAVNVPAAGGHGGPGADPDEAAERNRELREARDFFASKGLRVETAEGYGDPSDVLIDEARDAEADLIVVGTRGRNKVEGLLLGSVSTRLVQNAPCSVLVAR
jgi:nucleotide-binding universal stress UspA family protein